MPKNNQKLSDQDIIMIEHYASKGKKDVDIAKKLGFSYSSVNKYTTIYWERKMKGKHE